MTDGAGARGEWLRFLVLLEFNKRIAQYLMRINKWLNKGSCSSQTSADRWQNVPVTPARIGAGDAAFKNKSKFAVWDSGRKSTGPPGVHPLY
jgi:hypothetical protein